MNEYEILQSLITDDLKVLIDVGCHRADFLASSGIKFNLKLHIRQYNLNEYFFLTLDVFGIQILNSPVYIFYNLMAEYNQDFLLIFDYILLLHPSLGNIHLLDFKTIKYCLLFTW